MASPIRSRDLTDEQNERLRPIVRELVKKVGGQVALGKLVGMGQSAVSGFLSGRQGTSVAVALRACVEAKIDPKEVLGEDVPWKDLLDERPKELRSEMSAGSFVMKLDRLPGLRPWLEDHPTELTVTQLIEGIAIYESAKPASTSDGVPEGGWSAFFADALSGRLLNSLPGMKSEAESLERSQLSPAGRKRLRSTPKNR